MMRTLTLRGETLAELTDVELSGVAGGQVVTGISGAGGACLRPPYTWDCPTSGPTSACRTWG